MKYIVELYHLQHPGETVLSYPVLLYIYIYIHIHTYVTTYCVYVVYEIKHIDVSYTRSFPIGQSAVSGVVSSP